MKKILLIIGCIITLAATSCTKQYVTPGSTNETVYATVNTTDWTLFTDGKSYFASIKVSDLSSNFNQIGGIIVAISYDNGSTYEQLPEVYNGTSFSFTYNTGNVSIYAQSPDGSTAIKPTQSVKVKIILVDSN
jgi:opacity protein-like surface antigen